MREIKFRGMDVNGVMRYGQLSQDKPNSTLYYEKCSQRICWDYSNIPVTNESLGQYTGLKDKNGKEIYEGDILRYGDDDASEIVWATHSACFQLCYGDGTCADAPLPQRECEVIGNIYENPELLKDNSKEV